MIDILRRHSRSNERSDDPRSSRSRIEADERGDGAEASLTLSNPRLNPAATNEGRLITPGDIAAFPWAYMFNLDEQAQAEKAGLIARLELYSKRNFILYKLSTDSRGRKNLFEIIQLPTFPTEYDLATITREAWGGGRYVVRHGDEASKNLHEYFVPGDPLLNGQRIVSDLPGAPPEAKAAMEEDPYEEVKAELMDAFMEFGSERDHRVLGRALFQKEIGIKLEGEQELDPEEAMISEFLDNNPAARERYVKGLMRRKLGEATDGRKGSSPIEKINELVMLKEALGAFGSNKGSSLPDKLLDLVGDLVESGQAGELMKAAKFLSSPHVVQPPQAADALTVPSAGSSKERVGAPHAPQSVQLAPRVNAHGVDSPNRLTSGAVSEPDNVVSIHEVDLATLGLLIERPPEEAAARIIAGATSNEPGYRALWYAITGEDSAEFISNMRENVMWPPVNPEAEGAQPLDELLLFIFSDQGSQWLQAVRGCLDVRDEKDLARLMEEIDIQDTAQSLI